MILIKTVNDPVQMSYLKAMLAAEGIDANVQESVRGMAYRIFVAEEQEADARKLVDALESE